MPYFLRLSNVVLMCFSNAFIFILIAYFLKKYKVRDKRESEEQQQTQCTVERFLSLRYSLNGILFSAHVLFCLYT